MDELNKKLGNYCAVCLHNPCDCKLDLHSVIKSVCDLYDEMNDCDRFRFKKHDACEYCRYKKTVL